jgi:hypothetical protein
LELREAPPLSSDSPPENDGGAEPHTSPTAEPDRT